MAARRPARWQPLQLAIVGVVVTLSAATVFLLVVTGASAVEGERYRALWVRPLGALTMVTIGYLVASRRPDLAVGWLAFGVALYSALSGVIDGNDLYSEKFAHSAPPITLALLPGSWLLIPLLVGLMIATFPDGALHAAHWRWVVPSQIIIAAAGVVLFVLAPGRSGGLDNPYGVVALMPAAGLLRGLGNLFGVAVMAIGVVSLAARYRSGSAVVRHQIKWLLFACALAVLTLAFTIPWPLQWVHTLGDVMGLGLFGSGIAVAILRYRLFDIDLVINRAVVYGSVTAILAGAFAGLSVGTQYVLRSLTGQESQIASVVLAVVATAAFAPLKMRVQSIVDRRLKGEPSGQIASVAASE